ncbi:MAG: response regulator, partial [Hyphomicrobiales bacterium]|nr:response regulator [Hyphomicrobiales bacterium]
MRVLLVEDDEMIGAGLATALRREGASVDWARTAPDGAEALATCDYAIALVDLGLPGGDGLDLLRAARVAGRPTPVLVLTARDGIDDRVAGLELGADDYLVKPFEYRELSARIRAILRRRAGSAS